MWLGVFRLHTGRTSPLQELEHPLVVAVSRLHVACARVHRFHAGGNIQEGLASARVSLSCPACGHRWNHALKWR